MKIALISFRFDSAGGAEAVPRILAKELVRRGESVTIITTHRDLNVGVEETDGFTVYRFRPLNLYWVGDKDRHSLLSRAAWQLVDIWNPHAYAMVRRILRSVRPDVVHVHKLRGLSPSVWTAVRGATSAPIVHTCHDYELISPEGTLTSTVGRWVDRGLPLTRPYPRFRSRLSRTVDAVTAPSAHTLGRHLDHGFFASALRKVIPNSHGWRSDELPRLSSNQGREATWVPRLLYLGRLEEEKGVRLLLRVASRIEGPFRLEIAGWGRLENLVQEYCAQDQRIRYHGRVAGDQKGQLIRESDALIVPSLWPEVFGSVIVEAYSHGTPVIAHSIGGIPEIVKDGVTGWLVSATNETALAEAIARAVSRPRDLARMEEACRTEAAKYTVQAGTDEYQALYRVMLRQQVCGG